MLDFTVVTYPKFLRRGEMSDQGARLKFGSYPNEWKEGEFIIRSDVERYIRLSKYVEWTKNPPPKKGERAFCHEVSLSIYFKQWGSQGKNKYFLRKAYIFVLMRFFEMRGGEITSAHYNSKVRLCVVFRGICSWLSLLCRFRIKKLSKDKLEKTSYFF